MCMCMCMCTPRYGGYMFMHAEHSVNNQLTHYWYAVLVESSAAWCALRVRQADSFAVQEVVLLLLLLDSLDSVMTPQCFILTIKSYCCWCPSESPEHQALWHSHAYVA